MRSIRTARIAGVEYTTRLPAGAWTTDSPRLLVVLVEAGNGLSRHTSRITMFVPFRAYSISARIAFTLTAFRLSSRSVRTSSSTGIR